MIRKLYCLIILRTYILVEFMFFDNKNKKLSSLYIHLFINNSLMASNKNNK